MQENIKIESCIRIGESPFILTLNNKFQFVGDKARALENFCKKGMKAQVNFHMCNNDFLVDDILFPKEYQKGTQLNITA